MTLTSAQEAMVRRAEKAAAGLTETDAFAEMMQRLLAAWAARVGCGDTYDLAEFVEFGRSYDAAVRDAVQLGHLLQPEAWSWTNVGDAVGVSRQAARQRWMMQSTTGDAPASAEATTEG